MSDNTKISWSDATWNPVSGCTEVSPGCAHCYAKTFAERWRGVKGNYYENGFDVTLRPNMLTRPLTWKKPRRIFVNSMSDLFHEDVPDEYIRRCFEVMHDAHWHTFQILTKRIQRAFAFLDGNYEEPALGGLWPLPNVLIGPTVENQRMADERLAILAKIKALGWRTMVSYEPALQRINWMGRLDAVDWLICGGESGNGRRPFDHEWARAALHSCRMNGVPFFMKQDGAFRSEVYDTLPDDLKVREFPR